MDAYKSMLQRCICVMLCSRYGCMLRPAKILIKRREKSLKNLFIILALANSVSSFAGSLPEDCSVYQVRKGVYKVKRHDGKISKTERRHPGLAYSGDLIPFIKKGECSYNALSCKILNSYKFNGKNEVAIYSDQKQISVPFSAGHGLSGGVYSDYKKYVKYGVCNANESAPCKIQSKSFGDGSSYHLVVRLDRKTGKGEVVSTVLNDSDIGESQALNLLGHDLEELIEMGYCEEP